MTEDEKNDSRPSESQPPDSLPPESQRSSMDDQELKLLMRRALGEADEHSSVDVLSGVQQRLRERSEGKFYGDGWSTSRHPPFATYFITSLMMLAIVAIIYAILTPVVGDPIELPTEPKPVQIIPPARK